MGALAAIGSDYEEVVEVVGDEPARLLSQMMGGTRIYVPAAIGAQHELAVVIGIAAARKLADHFKGTTISIPKAGLRRSRALELARSGVMEIRKVAVATDYSERQVYRILAEDRDDGDQLSLNL